MGPACCGVLSNISGLLVVDILLLLSISLDIFITSSSFFFPSCFPVSFLVLYFLTYLFIYIFVCCGTNMSALIMGYLRWCSLAYVTVLSIPLQQLYTFFFAYTSFVEQNHICVCCVFFLIIIMIPFQYYSSRSYFNRSQFYYLRDSILIYISHN